MAKFVVTFEEKLSYDVEVEAENAQDALLNAYRRFRDDPDPAETFGISSSDLGAVSMEQSSADPTREGISIDIDELYHEEPFVPRPASPAP